MLGFTDRPESSRAWARLYKKRPGKLFLLLIFFFLFRGWTCPKNCQGPGEVGARPNHMKRVTRPPTRGFAVGGNGPGFVSRKLKIRKHSAAIPQSSACNRSSLAFVTFQSGSTR